MQIAFCLFKYFPYGGIQRDFIGMARECVSRGFQVRVYTLDWLGDRPDTMTIIEVPSRGMSNHVRYRRFAQWVGGHLARNPVDLVVGMNKMPGLDVYYAGDSCFEEKVRSQRSFWYRLTPRYRLFSEFEQAVFKRDSRTQIFSISDREKQFFQKYYSTPTKRFHRLPPGVGRDRLRPQDYNQVRLRVRSEFGIAEDEHLILFIGSGYIKKGLDRAITAFNNLSIDLKARSRMLILGEDRSTRFDRMISKLNLADRVRILGGRNDVPDFLFAADVLVLPAYDELAGIVIVEAIVAGLPVLVTENCGFAHYVREASAGLIQPLPFVQQDFDKKLERLLVSPEREQWQQNGLLFSSQPEIYQLFEKAVDKIEALLGDISEQGNSTRNHVEQTTPETIGAQVTHNPPNSQKRGSSGIQGGLLLAFCLFKYFPFGGMQRDFRRILACCLAAGYATRVYALSWQGEIPDGVELVIVPVVGVTNHARYARFIRWVLDDLASRPVDLRIGFNKMPGLDYYFAADPCFIEKALEHRSRLYRSTPRYRFFSTVEETVFKPNGETHILYLSDRQKASFQRFYATPDDRFTLLSPGVEKNRQRPENAGLIRQEFRRGFELREQDRLLLMIGSGFRTKGVTRSLRALSKLDGYSGGRVRLMVIGQDNPAPFRKVAERLGVEDRFEIIAGREDIPRFLLGADLLLHPAYSENTGSVILEAMIAGLPVIASAVCGYAHYINDVGAGCVIEEPFEQEEFVTAIANALVNTELRERWSRAGVAFGLSDDIYQMPQQVLSLITQKTRPGRRAGAQNRAGSAEVSARVSS